MHNPNDEIAKKVVRDLQLKSDAGDLIIKEWKCVQAQSTYCFTFASDRFEAKGYFPLQMINDFHVTGEHIGKRHIIDELNRVSQRIVAIRNREKN